MMDMLRLSVFLMLALVGLAVPAAAAPAQADLFTVSGVKVEAAAEIGNICAGRSNGTGPS